ncbi:unnamed protein product [Vitrella brassicaformis CCMP3155]|uniref:14 kDa phosphohistidine phosphatase n=1 Tax=Vitrella brassicaformis (strain CCMP3155) TaxID=1169540 RepID=A0A0G4GHB4_VITBC|nr:unnamed protein product [Vitrella brassicaformis CCMP3155]|mmetsp:Transcript_37900/g.108250  ORF Transcript_37900/g.108250 Transcript_37900/m.108250 type:complete len:181 (+) Transcript_37900:172-714(+)|eukprot:CEM29153.1 unnamed protein product [Vitrella brassicaformis CCMP3155]
MKAWRTEKERLEDDLKEINEKLATEADDACRSQLQQEARELVHRLANVYRDEHEDDDDDDPPALEGLDDIPQVEIDAGVFKYALIEATDPSTKERKPFIRGSTDASYHYQAAMMVTDRLDALGIDYEVTGGGRIRHSPANKEIEIYGYSNAYGRADHAVTAELCQQKYPNYKVTWGNYGY